MLEISLSALLQRDQITPSGFRRRQRRLQELRDEFLQHQQECQSIDFPGLKDYSAGPLPDPVSRIPLVRTYQANDALLQRMIGIARSVVRQAGLLPMSVMPQIRTTLLLADLRKHLSTFQSSLQSLRQDTKELWARLQPGFRILLGHKEDGSAFAPNEVDLQGLTKIIFEKQQNMTALHRATRLEWDLNAWKFRWLTDQGQGFLSEKQKGLEKCRKTVWFKARPNISQSPIVSSSYASLPAPQSLSACDFDTSPNGSSHASSPEIEWVDESAVPHSLIVQDNGIGTGLPMIEKTFGPLQGNVRLHGPEMLKQYLKSWAEDPEKIGAATCPRDQLRRLLESSLRPQPTIPDPNEPEGGNHAP